MPAYRFFARAPLAPGPADMPPEELHHLSVMRLKDHESFELIDGEGHLAQAHLVKGKPIITEVSQSAPERRIIIAQAIPKATKLDWLTEKCAELGAAELWLYPGELSEKTQISDSLLKRLESIALAACKQSGRLFLMKIVVKPPLKQWTERPLYYGDQQGSTQMPTGDFIFVVGPEKGLTAKEKALLQHPLSLSPYTLRTETAALALLAIAQHGT